MIKLAKLTAKGRKAIKPSNFAIPPGAYPIHDESHARDALAMVSKNGTQGEQQKVKGAVRRKYPGIKVSGN